MNQETIKEHLRSYKELMREVEREIESAEYWRRKAYSLSSVNYENLGIRSNRKTDNGEFVLKFLELQKRCTLLAEEAQRRKEEILASISAIDEADCREVVAMRYIDGLSFKEIAEKLHYSIRWVFNKHSKGIKKIQSQRSVQ